MFCETIPFVGTENKMLYSLLGFLFLFALIPLLTYFFCRTQGLKEELEITNSLWSESLKKVATTEHKLRLLQAEYNDALQRFSGNAGRVVETTGGIFQPSCPTITYVAKEVVETKVGRKWVRVEVLRVDPVKKTLTVRKLTGKRRPRMVRGFDGVKRTGDRVTANIFADWLTDNGLQEAADRLRQAFPLEEGESNASRPSL